MKTATLSKIFVLLAALASFSGTARGQHRITEVQYSDKINRTIVREYEFPATVSYVETADTHFFVYADASMQVFCAPVDKDIYVRDFVIHGKYAYFCGFRSGNVTKGIWGWFNVDDLVNGAVTYNTFSDFQCQPQYVDTIHSLAVHEEQNGFHIAMVGANTDGASMRRWCLIDVWGTPGSSTGWQYEMGIPFCNNCPCDRLTRICVTDNYIVAAGNYINPAHSETYRIHSRNSVFGGPQNYIYAYPLFGDGFMHDSTLFAMTHVYGDLIAVANKAHKIFLNTPYDGILVNVYDIALTVAYTNVSPVYSMCFSLNNFPSTGYSICDLRYSANQSILHLLLSGTSLPNTSSPGSIIAELSIPPGVSGPYTTINDRILLSLDNYYSQGNTLAAGFDNTNSTKMNYYTQPLQSTPQCGTQSPFPYTSNGYKGKKDYSPYTICTDSFKCKDNKSDVKVRKNIKICP